MLRTSISLVCAAAILAGCGGPVDLQSDTGSPPGADSSPTSDTGSPPDQDAMAQDDASIDLDTGGIANGTGMGRDGSTRDGGMPVDVPVVTITPPGTASCTDSHTSSMCPGYNCLACHRAGGLAPLRIWTAAGTIYNGPTAPQRPGLSGVQVTITDATGRVVNLTTNTVGNFYTSASLRYPISVQLGHSGATAQMTDRTMYGGCNACHTTPPNVGAPGRAYVGP